MIFYCALFANSHFGFYKSNSASEVEPFHLQRVNSLIIIIKFIA